MADEIRIPVSADTTPMLRDIENVASKARVSIRANLDSKQLEAFARPLGKITGQADEFSKSMEAANARVLAFGASVGVVNALANGFKNLIASTIEVEKSLNEIKVIGNDTFSNLDQVSKGLFSTAKQLGVSYKDAANATLEFARQGKDLQASLEASRAALTLTRTTGLDAAESVKGLTSAVNVFSESGLTYADIVNKMSAVDSKFAVNSKDLIEGISRSASVAQEAGVSFDELTALITTLQEKTGRGGAVIGNALKTIFTRVQNPEILKDIRDLGIAVTDTSGNFLPATRIIQSLANEFDGLDANVRKNILLKVGGGFQIDKLAAALNDMANANGTFQRSLQTSQSNVGNAFDKVTKLNQTVDSAFNNVLSSAKEAGSLIGRIGFSEDFRKILEGGSSFFDAITGGLGGNNGEEGLSVGQTLARGIVKGIGSVITGPGLFLFGGILLKLGTDFAKFSTSALQTQLGITSKTKEEQAIQQSISTVLSSNTDLQVKLLNLEGDKVTQAAVLLDYYTRIAASMERQKTLSKDLSAALYAGGVRVASGTLEIQGAVAPTAPPPKRAAAGYIPNLASAIATEKAQSPAGSRILVDHNFPMGGGQKGTMVYNSNETRIKNFAGTGGDAIIPNYPTNAASGYTPNFANQEKEKIKKLAVGGKGQLNIDARSIPLAGITMGGTKPVVNGKSIEIDDKLLKNYIGSPFFDKLKQYDRISVQNVDSGAVYRFRQGLKDNEGTIANDFVSRLNRSVRPQVLDFIQSEMKALGLAPGGGLNKGLESLNFNIMTPSSAGYVLEEIIKAPTLTTAEKVAQYAAQSEKAYFDIQNLSSEYAEAYGLPKKDYAYVDVKSSENELERTITKKFLNQAIYEGGGTKLRNAARGYIPNFADKQETFLVSKKMSEFGNIESKNKADAIDQFSSSVKIIRQDKTIKDYGSEADSYIKKIYPPKNNGKINLKQLDKIEKQFSDAGASQTSLKTFRSTLTNSSNFSSYNSVIKGILGELDAKQLIGKNIKGSNSVFDFAGYVDARTRRVDDPSNILIKGVNFWLRNKSYANKKEDKINLPTMTAIVPADSKIGIGLNYKNAAKGFIPNFANTSNMSGAMMRYSPKYEITPSKSLTGSEAVESLNKTKGTRLKGTNVGERDYGTGNFELDENNIIASILGNNTFFQAGVSRSDIEKDLLTFVERLTAGNRIIGGGAGGAYGGIFGSGMRDVRPNQIISAEISGKFKNLDYSKLSRIFPRLWRAKGVENAWDMTKGILALTGSEYSDSFDTPTYSKYNKIKKSELSDNVFNLRSYTDILRNVAIASVADYDKDLLGFHLNIAGTEDEAIMKNREFNSKNNTSYITPFGSRGIVNPVNVGMRKEYLNEINKTLTPDLKKMFKVGGNASYGSFSKWFDANQGKFGFKTKKEAQEELSAALNIKRINYDAATKQMVFEPFVAKTASNGFFPNFTELTGTGAGMLYSDPNYDVLGSGTSGMFLAPKSGQGMGQKIFFKSNSEKAQHEYHVNKSLKEFEKQNPTLFSKNAISFTNVGNILTKNGLIAGFEREVIKDLGVDEFATGTFPNKSKNSGDVNEMANYAFFLSEFMSQAGAKNIVDEYRKLNNDDSFRLQDVYAGNFKVNAAMQKALTDETNKRFSLKNKPKDSYSEIKSLAESNGISALNEKYGAIGARNIMFDTMGFSRDAVKTASSGYMPNFASEKQQAILREKMATGLPDSMIKVSTDSRAVHPILNPTGQIITNKIDEPNGASDVTPDRMKNAYKNASRGFMPNFANAAAAGLGSALGVDVSKLTSSIDSNTKTILQSISTSNELSKNLIQLVAIEKAKNVALTVDLSSFKYGQAGIKPGEIGSPIDQNQLRTQLSTIVPKFAERSLSQTELKDFQKEFGLSNKQLQEFLKILKTGTKDIEGFFAKAKQKTNAQTTGAPNAQSNQEQPIDKINKPIEETKKSFGDLAQKAFIFQSAISFTSGAVSSLGKDFEAFGNIINSVGQIGYTVTQGADLFKSINKGRNIGEVIPSIASGYAAGTAGSTATGRIGKIASGVRGAIVGTAGVAATEGAAGVAATGLGAGSAVAGLAVAGTIVAGSALLGYAVYKGIDALSDVFLKSAKRTASAIEAMNSTIEKYGSNAPKLNEFQNKALERFIKISDIKGTGVAGQLNESGYGVSNMYRRGTKYIGQDTTYLTRYEQKLAQLNLGNEGNQLFAKQFGTLITQTAQQKTTKNINGKEVLPNAYELDVQVTKEAMTIIEQIKAETKNILQSYRPSKEELEKAKKDIEKSMGYDVFDNITEKDILKQARINASPEITNIAQENVYKNLLPQVKAAEANQNAKQEAILFQTELFKKQLEISIQTAKIRSSIPSYAENQLSIEKDLLKTSIDRRVQIDLELKSLESQRQLASDIREQLGRSANEGIGKYLERTSSLGVSEPKREEINALNQKLVNSTNPEQGFEMYAQILDYIDKGNKSLDENIAKEKQALEILKQKNGQDEVAKKENETQIKLKEIEIAKLTTTSEKAKQDLELQRNQVTLLKTQAQVRDQIYAKDVLNKAIQDQINSAYNMRKEMIVSVLTNEQKSIDLAQKQLDIQNRISDAKFKTSLINSSNPNEDPFIAQRKTQLREINLPAQRELAAYETEKQRALITDKQSMVSLASQRGATLEQMSGITNAKTFEEAQKKLAEVINQEGNQFENSVKTAASYFFDTIKGASVILSQSITGEIEYRKPNLDLLGIRNPPFSDDGFFVKKATKERITSESFISDLTKDLLQRNTKSLESRVSGKEFVGNVISRTQIANPTDAINEETNNRRQEFNQSIRKRFFEFESQRLSALIAGEQKALEYLRQRIADQEKLKDLEFEGKNLKQFNPFEAEKASARYQINKILTDAQNADIEANASFFVESKNRALTEAKSKGASPEDLQAIVSSTSLDDIISKLQKVIEKNIDETAGKLPGEMLEDGAKKARDLMVEGGTIFFKKVTGEDYSITTSPSSKVGDSSIINSLPLPKKSQEFDVSLFGGIASAKELEFQKQQIEDKVKKAGISLEELKNKSYSREGNAEGLDEIELDELSNKYAELTENISSLNSAVSKNKESASMLARFAATGNPQGAGPVSKMPGAIQQYNQALDNQKTKEENQTKFERGFRSGIGQIDSDIQKFDAKLGEQLPRDFATGMKDALKELSNPNSTEPLKTRLLGVALAFTQKIQDAFLTQATNKFTSSIFGGNGFFGGANGMADGGPVIGGSGAKDDVPMMLMGGEYVVKKSAVEKYGHAYLDALNHGSVMMKDTSTKKSAGGLIPGDSALTGEVPAMLMGGEYVLDKTAVQKYGLGYLSGLNKGAVQKFAEGGPVIGGSGAKDDVSMNLIGGQFVVKKSAVDKYGHAYMDALNHGSVAIKNTSSKKSAGGLIPGDSALTGEVPALLMGGEYVLDKTAVQKYGLGYLSGLNKGSVQKFAEGGPVIGGSGAKDDVSMTLLGGQFVVKKSAVDKYGHAYMDALNHGSVAMKNGASKKSAGGLIPGDSALTGEVPALLMGGEYVLDKTAVQKYGLGYLSGLNKGNVQKFAGGGLVNAQEVDITKYQDPAKTSPYGQYRNQGLSFDQNGSVVGMDTYKGTAENKQNELRKAQSNYYAQNAQSGEGGFYMPGQNGMGAIMGQRNLLSFATQQTAGTQFDKFSGGTNSAGVDLGAGSANMSLFALRDEGNSRNASYLQAKQKSLDLYLGGIDATKEKANKEHDILEEQKRIKEEAKKREKEMYKGMLVSLGVSVGMAGLGALASSASTGWSAAGQAAAAEGRTATFGEKFQGAFSGGTMDGQNRGGIANMFSSSGYKDFSVIGDKSGSGLQQFNNKTNQYERMAPADFTKMYGSGKGLSYDSMGTPYKTPNTFGYAWNRKASGGSVYGNGMGDNVPTMLNGGEFVISKQAAQNVGVNKLQQINSGGKAEDSSELLLAKLDELVEKLSAVGTLNITVNSDSNGKQSEKQEGGGRQDQQTKDLAKKIKEVVMNVLKEEKRLGGMLR